jgi:hypothetical protein
MSNDDGKFHITLSKWDVFWILLFMAAFWVLSGF